MKGAGGRPTAKRKIHIYTVAEAGITGRGAASSSSSSPLSSASLPSFLFSSLLSSNFHGAHGGRGGLSPPCPHAKSAPAYTCDRGVYLDHPYISRFVLKYNFRYILRAIYSTGTKQGLTSMPQFSHQYPYDTSGHK